MRTPHSLLRAAALVLVLIAPIAARAQTPDAPAPAADSSAALTPEALAESALVGLPEHPTLAETDPRFDAEGRPRDYLAEARAGFTAENRTYQSIRVTLSIARPLFGLGVALFLLFSGLSARLRDLSLRTGRRLYVQMLVYFALYMGALWVITFPLRWYGEWALEGQFKLGTQTFGAWLLDDVKSTLLMIGVLGVVPILTLAWMKLRQSPRRWWLWLAAGTLPVATAAMILDPLVFEPMFNKFTPLHDAELRQDILDLAWRAGIPSRNVYEVDMSKQTNKVNAYVSGFGASQRIVLWDTTLQKLRRDEILFVMGHEMGHYVLAHTWKILGVIGVGAFIVFGLASRVLAWAIARWGRAWGFTELGDLASLPLLAATVSLILAFAQPGLNTLGRGVEHESDVYGLEITRDNDAAARAFLALAANNRSDPEPPAWVKAWMYTHPPLGERIRFATEYRPWERGVPNKLYKGEVAGGAGR